MSDQIGADGKRGTYHILLNDPFPAPTAPSRPSTRPDFPLLMMDLAMPFAK